MKPESSHDTGERAGEDVCEPVLALSTFLPYRLNVLAAMVSEQLARTYSERFGISVPEWRVLATVGEFHSMTAKAIGAHAHMGKVKVSRAASSLEARELITRLPNRDDMREAFLVLTPAGEDVYARIVPLALAYAERLRHGFSSSETDMLDRLIDKLILRVGEMATETDSALA